MNHGLLISVSRFDAEGNECETPQIEVLQAQIGKEAALDEVKKAERADIHFDLMSAEDDERPIYEARLAEVEKLEWPLRTNADGQWAIGSVNQLGLDEDGFEYRFVPVTLNKD